MASSWLVRTAGPSVPHEVFLAGAVVLVAILACGWRRAPVVFGASERPLIGGGAGLRRVRLARIAIGLLVVALVTVTAWASLYQPLRYGNSWGGSDPHLVAIRGADMSSEYDYAYAPGGEIRFEIDLVNDGDLPLTVTGLDQVRSPYVASVEFRLPVAPTRDALPLYPDARWDRWYSEPFAPFELPAQGGTTIALVVRLRDCPGIEPLPTLAPGASVVYDAPPTQTGFTAVTEVGVRYTMLGIEHVARIPLPAALNVLVGGSTLGCPLSP